MAVEFTTNGVRSLLRFPLNSLDTGQLKNKPVLRLLKSNYLWEQASLSSLSSMSSGSSSTDEKIQKLLKFRVDQEAKQDLQLKSEDFVTRQLPRKSSLRVMSWNIHEAWMYSDSSKTTVDTWKALWDDISLNNPDVVMLQEFPVHRIDDAYPTKLGYFYVKSCTYGIHARDKMLVTYSKYPIVYCESNARLDRGVLHTAITLPGQHTVLVTNIHLSHSFELLRESQLSVARKRGKTWALHVIGGDFNSEIEFAESVLNVGMELHGYKDSFRAVYDKPNTEATQWRGSAIDFFMISSNLVEHVKDSYVFHSPNSDHIPIVMDL